MTTAMVVGSGPNGLAAALTLAAQGVEVTVLEAADTPGGGTRSSTEVTLPGLLHDVCSGFHPLAVDTAFSRTFDLEAHGLEWAHAPVQYAHPLEGGDGAAVWRSAQTTAEALGPDRRSYERLFDPLTSQFDKIATEFLQPMVHIPRHPLALARFGAYSLLPARLLARRWRTDAAQGLFAGVAAHAFRPLTAPMSSAIGVALGTAAHRFGWPVAVGGSGMIAEAMLASLLAHGGRVETGVVVKDHRELASADVVMLDTSPRAAVEILGPELPRRVQRAYRRYKFGPGAFQVAFAVEGGIPWTYEPARDAGTVHVGGTFDEIASAEQQIWKGQMPARPFVLVGQQGVADPSRIRDGVHPVDSYAHVPAGWKGDATEAVIAQIERYAPGFKDRVRAVHSRSTTQITADNANYVGGDIATGANTPRQLVFRPRASLNPYSTGTPGVYLCSAATPPGAGAHGMSGWHAANAALAHLSR